MRKQLLAAGLALLPAITSSAGMEFNWDDGLRFESGPVRATLGLQANFDFGRLEDTAGVTTDATLNRRLRPSLSLAAGKHWSGRVDLETGDISPGVKNAWVQWRPSTSVALRLGSQSVSFGLDSATGSQDSPFLERPISQALGPGLLVGGEVTFSRPAGSLSIGYFGNSIDDEDRRALSGKSLVMRLSGNPLVGQRGLWHLGLSAELRQADDVAAFRLDPRPESYFPQPRLVDTRDIPAVNELVNVNLETAWQHGPAILQGEFLHGHLTRTANNLAATDFSGWYGSLSVALTGERRRYSRGSGGFGGIKPRHGWGALELALRVSELDLNDLPVSGGRQRTETVALNYYYRERVRLMLSLARSDATTRNRLDVETKVAAARLQVSF